MQSYFYIHVIYYITIIVYFAIYLLNVMLLSLKYFHPAQGASLNLVYIVYVKFGQKNIQSKFRYGNHYIMRNISYIKVKNKRLYPPFIVNKKNC